MFYDSPLSTTTINTPETQAQLFASLVKAIAESKDVHADANNPFHKSKYATLSAHLSEIKPIFAKHNLAILQLPIGNSESVGIRTCIIHSNGAMISSDALVPVSETKKKDKNTGEEYSVKEMSGQQAGSLFSYLRRYALASVAGVATDDDDSESDREVRSYAKPVSKTVDVTAPAPNTKFISNTILIATPAGTNAVNDIDPSMPVPFGNNKGTPIGELQEKDLSYWATKWEPRPYEKTGKVTAKDAKLKATAVALYSMSSNSNPIAGGHTHADEVPF
jgi:hypothetical protein